MLGFILLPSLLFAFAARRQNARLARLAGLLTVLGVVLNRFNVSLIAFNWNVADRYVPSMGEVVTSLTIVTIGVLIFRWIVNRMPVVHEHPDWRGAH
jgi:Ni/Fe-hydrogenase subunit HybB-like protein